MTAFASVSVLLPKYGCKGFRSKLTPEGISVKLNYSNTPVSRGRHWDERRRLARAGFK
jgi:hypothetical protein